MPAIVLDPTNPVDRIHLDLLRTLANLAASAWSLNAATDTGGPLGTHLRSALRLATEYHPVDPVRVVERLAQPLVDLLGVNPWGRFEFAAPPLDPADEHDEWDLEARSFLTPEPLVSYVDDPASAAQWEAVLIRAFVDHRAAVDAEARRRAPALAALLDTVKF
jgi:hypothetical protein